MAEPTLAALRDAYDRNLTLEGYWDALGRPKFWEYGNYPRKPRGFRAYLVDRVEPYLDRLPDGGKAVLRWVLWCDTWTPRPADKGTAREELAVPEGYRLGALMEGQAIRERYPWDPPDLLDQWKAGGLLAPLEEDARRV